MREDRHRKFFGIRNGGALMVSIANDDAGYQTFLPQPAELRICQRDRINQVNSRGQADAGGKEIGLNRGIIILPNEKAGAELSEFCSGGGHLEPKDVAF